MSQRLIAGGRSSVDRGDSYQAAGELLRDWFRVVYRRRLLAVTMFVLVVAAMTGYTYTREPVFTAQAQILIEPAGPNIISFEEVLDEGRGNGNYYQTQYELLRSRALARRTVRRLNLTRHPYFGGSGVATAAATSGGALTDTAPTANAAVLANDARDDEAPLEGLAAEAGPIGALLGGLQVAPVRATRLVNISFQSTDPVLAADVANAHAEQYIEQNLEFRVQASQAAGDWLTVRLEQERRRVEEAESALQRYREQHDAVSLEEGQNIVVQKLGELNTAVTKAKTRRLEAEAQYQQVAALQAESLDSFPAVLSNELIQKLKVDLASLQRESAQLSQTLGDRHPRIVERATAIQITEARIQQEIRTIVASLRAAFESALAEETSLTAALEMQKREAMTQNRRGIEYGVLKREADSTRQVYLSLLQRAKETDVARELRASNIRVVDPAEVPRSPSSPNTRRNLMLGVLAGLILAVGAVFGRELIDERIKAPEDVNHYLGIPLLGLVPKVRRTSAAVYLNGDVQPAVEAFRALRSLLLYPADGSTPARSILITSTNRGEGKTVVATNLAIALARSRMRVLLIDADMRDPGVHTLFGETLEPGLSNVLNGEVALEAILRPTRTPDLELLPAGSHPSNPTELLGSPAFKQLLGAADGVFQYIIIDSPPVMAVADPVVIAHAAAASLFVVGADMTTRGAAQVAVQQLHSVGANVLGGVLNGADLRRHPYYYAPYYRPGYEPKAQPPDRSPLSIT